MRALRARLHNRRTDHARDAQNQRSRSPKPTRLSPLHEIALRAKGPLLKHIQSPDGQHAIFSALLSELQTVDAPTALIFEDVHWADAATLDLLKYLGRRIRNLPALLVLTYRDD